MKRGNDENGLRIRYLEDKKFGNINDKLEQMHIQFLAVDE